MTDAAQTPAIAYAGFWRRYAALFLDGLIYAVPLTLVGMVLAFVVAAMVGEDAAMVAFNLTYYGLFLLVSPLYFALQESSRHQATLGKRALGIKVTDRDGNRIGFGHALGRWFAAALNYITFYIGYMMAGWTGRKQGLHDMVAGTLVVDRWAWTEHPERQRHKLPGVAVAIIALVVVFVGLAVLGIVAAIAVPAYNDYTLRARVAEAYATTAPSRAEIEDAILAGTCPEAGDTPPGSPSVAGMRVGTLPDTGGCGIELTLAADLNEELANGMLWLEYDAEAREWVCWSDLADKVLPANCRG